MIQVLQIHPPVHILSFVPNKASRGLPIDSDIGKTCADGRAKRVEYFRIVSLPFASLGVLLVAANTHASSVGGKVCRGPFAEAIPSSLPNVWK